MKTKNMKLLLILTILFTLSACEIIDAIDDNVSECDAKANQIDPTEIRIFNMGCYVSWKDGSIAENLSVKYQIHKEYCNGDIAGSYEVYISDRLTNHRGWWNSWYEATYKYKNKKDKVIVKFIIAPGAYDYEYDYEYRWEDVDEDHELDYWGKVPSDIYITLPINADGS